jgi:phage shock protein A
MILGKFWSALRAQFNKLANVFWEADPIAQMRLQYDEAVEQLKDGRKGLELYRGLVERVNRQVAESSAQCQKLESQAKAYLKAGEREAAAKFALELQKARKELEEHKAQLDMHEAAYGNSLKKIQHANDQLIKVREKIQKYDAELRMSEAEAEIAKLSESFNVNVTTDFGQIEQVIQERIDTNRGKVRVASDLSAKGVADIAAEERVEKVMAEDALQALEVELGMRTPETAAAPAATKELGPATEKQTS